jgi:RND family efflux transporter MFP subunit
MDKQILKLLLTFYILLFVSPIYAITLNGFTDYSKTIKINARTTGIVKSIRVEPGQRVKKGDILIEMDGVSQKLQVDKAKAIVKSLRPVLDTAQLELERAQELFGRDSLSLVDLKNAENALAQAEGNYEAAQADSKLADYYLNHSIIRSPIDGRVLEVHVNQSQFQDPQQNASPMITLIDSFKMRAVALVNSDQWAPELLNTQASVLYRAKKFTGKVSYIGYKRIKQAGGTAAYEIHINFDTDTLIPADMPVSIDISN